jgi:uncharacterized membrane protein YeaQ/YmgE (transglycosylase-associated protein family)
LKENDLQIIGWIVFGLIAGIVAKLLMPGKDAGGLIITILLGIAGSLIWRLLGFSGWAKRRLVFELCDGSYWRNAMADGV